MPLPPEVGRTVHFTSAVSAGVAAILSPIPLADEILLVPLYGAMTCRVARRHELSLLRVPWRPILRTTVVGLATRAAVNLGASYLPGVAAVLNAGTAIALTEMLGRYVDRACADPSSARPLGAREIVGWFAPRRRAATAAAPPV